MSCPLVREDAPIADAKRELVDCVDSPEKKQKRASEGLNAMRNAGETSLSMPFGAARNGWRLGEASPAAIQVSQESKGTSSVEITSIPPAPLSPEGGPEGGGGGNVLRTSNTTDTQSSV